jgi:archaellum biogenesis ATPase FlaH
MPVDSCLWKPDADCKRRWAMTPAIYAPVPDVPFANPEGTTDNTRAWMAEESAKGRWFKDTDGNWTSTTLYQPRSEEEQVAFAAAMEKAEHPEDIDWSEVNGELVDPRAIQFEKDCAQWQVDHPYDWYDPKEAFMPTTEQAELGSMKSELKSTRGDMIKPKTIKWLWSNRIPFGKLTVFAGDPDQGKSLVTMYLTSMLTKGKPLYGSDVKLDPCDVLILAGEDEADDTVIPRLISNGADLKRVHIVESVATKDGKGKTLAEREAQLDLDMQAIENKLKSNPAFRLVIIDPLSNYLGNANMNREQEVRKILIPLKALAARMNVAIVAVMHLNKTADASAIHRIGGAVAFTGVARACWLFMADPEDVDRKMMLRIKGNIAKRVGGLTYKIVAKDLTIGNEPTTQPYVEWVGETESVASDILINGAPAGRPNEKVIGAKEWLADFLSHGYEKASDIEKFGKKQGYSWRTLNRAKGDLSINSFQEGRIWHWELPKPGTRIVEEPTEPVKMD